MFPISKRLTVEVAHAGDAPYPVKAGFVLALEDVLVADESRKMHKGFEFADFVDLLRGEWMENILCRHQGILRSDDVGNGHGPAIDGAAIGISRGADIHRHVRIDHKGV